MRRVGVDRRTAFVLAACVLGLSPSASSQPTSQEAVEALRGLRPVGLRSIPSESMLPNLLVGDRVIIVANATEPKRGAVVIFQHPNSDVVMIDRIIGLPGDTIEIKRGRLIVNGATVDRTLVRKVVYKPDDMRRVIVATEYRERLPGQDTPHLIHEFSDNESMDETPEFRVPPGHLFMMGDNRDNSEDSRAPSGHRVLAAAQPEAWANRSVFLPADPRDDAIGFVPVKNLMGQAAMVYLTLNKCRLDDHERADGAECLKSRIGERL
jgi:signal peptidase I